MNSHFYYHAFSGEVPRQDYYENTWQSEPDITNRVVPPFDPASDPNWGSKSSQDSADQPRKTHLDKKGSAYWTRDVPPSVPGWEWNTQSKSESSGTRDPFESKVAPNVPGWEWNTQMAKGGDKNAETTNNSFWKSKETLNVSGASWNTRQAQESRKPQRRYQIDPYFDPFDPAFEDPFFDARAPPGFPMDMPPEPWSARFRAPNAPPFYPSDERTNRRTPISRPARDISSLNPQTKQQQQQQKSQVQSTQQQQSQQTRPQQWQAQAPTSQQWQQQQEQQRYQPPSQSPSPINQSLYSPYGASNSQMPLRSQGEPQRSLSPPIPNYSAGRTSYTGNPGSSQNTPLTPQGPNSSMGSAVQGEDWRQDGRLASQFGNRGWSIEEDPNDNPIARAVSGGRIM